jgi:proline iminopeptidase
MCNPTGAVPRLLASLLLAAALSCAHQAKPGSGSPSLRQGPGRFTSHGVQIAFHVAGSGPILVAHPGGPGNEWSYLRMPELEKRFTVVYIEPVGTGASGALPSPDDYTMHRYVEDLEALRRHLGLSRFRLLGHSQGGFVAQHYALAHGDRLSELVLYDTTPTTGPEFQQDTQRNLTQLAQEPWYPDVSAALSERAPRTDQEQTALARRVAPVIFADYTGRKQEFDPIIQSLRSHVAPSRGSAGGIEVRAQLSAIRVPTLVLVGRRDVICSVEMAKLLDAGIPDSTLVVLERSGHVGHIEEPQAFARAVSEWFASRPQAGSPSGAARVR